jgi:hypothetical protein
MLHRIVTAYRTWNERSRARAVHFHAGPHGARACESRFCGEWAISADDAARIGFE